MTNGSWTRNDRALMAAVGIAPDEPEAHYPFDLRAVEAMLTVHRAKDIELRAEVRMWKRIAIGLLCAGIIELVVAVAKGKP